MEKRTDEFAFLVHGLLGNRLDMWPIAKTLRIRGLDSRLVRYRSIRNRIEPLIDQVQNELTTLLADSRYRTVHVAGYSMGGIICRAVLDRMNRQGMSLEKIGNVLFLAPPNRGSNVARKLAPWFNWLTPTLSQLSDTPDSFVNRLSQLDHLPDLNIGIMEASKDRVIPRGNVRLDRNFQYTCVKGHHGILTWYRACRDLSARFLLEGDFEPIDSDVNCKPVIPADATTR